MSNRVVYLHLGSPKTGTTFLQGMLRAHRDRLQQEGVYYPPTGRGDAHHSAVHDLRNIRRDGRPPAGAKGAWTRLAQAVRAWDGPGSAVISSELLAFATADEAARALRSLQPAEVHLVLTVRDLVRQVPAVWQENIKNGRVVTYEQFLQRLVDQEVPWNWGPWGGQEPATILGRWGRTVPPDRVHVVTVPPPGADPSVLWQRFARLVGADPARYPLVSSGANTSLGIAEAEALRRLNKQMGQVPRAFYGRHIKHGIAKGVLAGRPGSERLVLPEQLLPWAEGRTKQIIDSLSGRGFDIVGDLDDLLVPADGRGVGPLPDIDPERLAEASIAAAGYLARTFGRSWRRSPAVRAQVGGGTVRSRLSRLGDRHRAVDLLRRGYRVAGRAMRR